MRVQGNIVFPHVMGQLPTSSCAIVQLKELSYTQAFSNVIASEIIDLSSVFLTSLTVKYQLNSKKPVREHLRRVYTLSAIINIGWCR